MNLPLSSLSILLFLPALVAAQGSYTTLGSGCGKPGTAVHQVNPNPLAANFANQTGPNEYGYPVAVSATTTTVCTGVRFFTRSLGGVKTVEARAYLPSTSSPTMPDTTPLTTGRMTVGPTADWYIVNFDKPLIIKGPFWVSFDNYDTYTATSQGPSVVSASNLSTGTTITPIYWRRPNYQNRTWVITGSVKIPSYEILTGGAPAAQLSTTTPPSLGTLFQLDLSQATNGAVVAIFGASATQYGPIPLPLDLGAVAPGCFVFQSFDWLLTAGASGGTAKINLPIPNNKALVGIKFLNQWLILDKGANALGLTFSNGGEGTIG